MDLSNEHLMRQRRELNRGFGAAFTAALEMAITPGLFALAGVVLDRWLGLFPVFTFGLLGLALAGMFIKVWYAYDADMRRHEAELPGRPAPGRGADARG